ncbi:MAG: hypothetical protein ACK4FW_08205 [Stenotrophomonas sp.]
MKKPALGSAFLLGVFQGIRCRGMVGLRERPRQEVADEDTPMDSSEPDPAQGTPREYSDALYRVYFEVGEWQDIARDAITAFLVERSRDHPAFDFAPAALEVKAHGYEVDLPMQLIPEVVRVLAERNVGIYQVVRLHPV